ncbi:MAG: NAD(+)--dinitrogen-reductase ADP-D-ribosyltransferase [Verrucomicrobiota bacterium JB024]|nr:NAD(+)--dinitrogen-reductase ADP-D-ribosyltransferase [Verrucomicrobiota bacterium JB024]
MIQKEPGHITINHCEIPPWIIASDEFNIDPVPLNIAGVRESNAHLFRRLEEMDDPMARGQEFHNYIDVKFALHQWENYHGKARSSLRNSYIRFLRGWGVDSNGIEGAVLKSWVQSRFGILPTFHKGLLRPLDGEEDQSFAVDRMRGSAKTNCIFSQLDLLYEFCQYELRRRWPERQVLTLYRGTCDPEEHPVFETRDRRESCVRLNNLVSFTSDREKAWEFGSTVWQATVASTKVVFFSQLLPSQLLKGEDEFLVVGGNYWVRELLY